jgi:hypothetical protein
MSLPNILTRSTKLSAPLQPLLETPQGGKVFGRHLEFGLVAQHIEDHFLFRARMEP